MQIPFVSRWLERIESKAYQNGYAAGCKAADLEPVILRGGEGDGRVYQLRRGTEALIIPALDTLGAPRLVSETLPVNDEPLFKQIKYTRTAKTEPITVDAAVYVLT